MYWYLSNECNIDAFVDWFLYLWGIAISLHLPYQRKKVEKVINIRRSTSANLLQLLEAITDLSYACVCGFRVSLFPPRLLKSVLFWSTFAATVSFGFLVFSFTCFYQFCIHANFTTYSVNKISHVTKRPPIRQNLTHFLF